MEFTTSGVKYVTLITAENVSWAKSRDRFPSNLVFGISPGDSFMQGISAELMNRIGIVCKVGSASWRAPAAICWNTKHQYLSLAPGSWFMEQTWLQPIISINYSGCVIYSVCSLRYSNVSWLESAIISWWCCMTRLGHVPYKHLPKRGITPNRIIICL